MIEKKLIHEIPKSADFHSAVLTSFSFDFHLFESQVLRQFKSKGIINVNVLADDTMLDQAIGLSTGYLKSLSNSYVVNGVSSVGAFHPKIIFLAGEKDVMIIQGSGNITNGGHGKNHELFGVFYANSDDRSQLPIIQETWDYLKSLGERTAGVARDKMSWLENNCGLLNPTSQEKHSWHVIDEDLSAAVVYNETSSIWSQISGLVQADEIIRVSIVSPFYDEAGTFLANFAESFSNAEINAFIQEGKGIHPYKMEQNVRVTFSKWESTERASETIRKIESRKLHAKIIVFESDQEQFCLFGSPNATIKAFGTIATRGANDEFGTIIRSKSRNFLGELGLDGAHEKATPKEQPTIQNAEEILEQELTKRIDRLKIIGVDQDGILLTIYLKNKKALTQADCRIFDAWGILLESNSISLKNDKLLLELKSSKITKRVSFIQFFNEVGEEISNKQIVNNFYDIVNTNPSQENRRLLRLASIIELGNDKVFDVIDYMNTLRSARQPSAVFRSSGISSPEEVKTPLNSLSYDEVFALQHDEIDFQKNLQQHNSIHIWDAIEKYFNQSAISESEEDMDDEEEGSAAASRKRKEKKDRTEPIPLNSFAVLDRRRKAVEKFLVNYQHALKNSLKNTGHQIGLIDMAMFLIVIKQLIQFTDREVILKVTEEDENAKQVFYPVRGNLSEFTSFTGATLNLIGQFVNLCNQFKFQEVKDEYTAKKLSHYKTLVYRSSLFILSITREVYSEHPNGKKWSDNLAYNMINKFGDIESNLEDHFEELLKNVSIKNLRAEDLIKHINHWKENLSSLNPNEFLKDEVLGICNIEKKIPEIGKTKFLKISRPGFDYNTEVQNFLLSDLYDCNLKELKPSLQNRKKDVV
jgi:hypothetical protein